LHVDYAVERSPRGYLCLLADVPQARHHQASSSGTKLRQIARHRVPATDGQDHHALRTEVPGEAGGNGLDRDLDAGYAGKLTAWAETLNMTLEIVSKRDPHTFEVLPRRWVVERTFAWISKHRRTVRDYEHLPTSHEAMILWAMIALMTQRLAHHAH
jgi:hypothetical protein